MKTYLYILIFSFFIHSCIYETCFESRERKINDSFNIISPKNYKDDIFIDVYTKLEGINPETGNKDFYSDGFKWITPYRDSILIGDTLFKKKGDDFFLIKKKKNIIKVYAIKCDQNGKVNTTSPAFEILNR